MKPLTRRLLILVAFVFVGVQLVPTFANPTRGSDLIQDHVAARAWRAGDNPYEATYPLALRVGERADPSLQEGTPHPPALIIALAPLSFLPIGPARILLSAIAVGCFGAAVFLYLRRQRLPLFWVVLAFALPFAQADFRSGGISSIILLCLVGSWILLERDLDRGAGIVLALACALKLYPLLMLAPLAAAKRWRALGWTIGSFAFFSVVPMLLLGSKATFQWLRVASPANVRVWAGRDPNLSLGSLAYRILGWQPLICVVVLILCGWLAYRSALGGAVRCGCFSLRHLRGLTMPWPFCLSPQSAIGAPG